MADPNLPLPLEIPWTLASTTQPLAAGDRGRVETSNLHHHGVSSRSEASGIAAGVLCATAGADGFDRGGFESCAADVLSSGFCGVDFAVREGLRPSSLASAVPCP